LSEKYKDHEERKDVSTIAQW